MRFALFIIIIFLKTVIIIIIMFVIIIIMFVISWPSLHCWSSQVKRSEEAADSWEVAPSKIPVGAFRCFHFHFLGNCTFTFWEVARVKSLLEHSGALCSSWPSIIIVNTLTKLKFVQFCTICFVWQLSLSNFSSVHFETCWFCQCWPGPKRSIVLTEIYLNLQNLWFR